jgi:hypothetical protein
MYHSPVAPAPAPRFRPVPRHLFGTRAALFHLWAAQEARRQVVDMLGVTGLAGASFAPAMTVTPRLAAPEPVAAPAPQQNRLQEALLDDVFIF